MRFFELLFSFGSVHMRLRLSVYTQYISCGPEFLPEVQLFLPNTRGSVMLGFPSLAGTAVGASLTLVGKLARGPQGSILTDLWTGDSYLLHECSLEEGVWTLFDYVLVDMHESFGVLSPTATSLALPKPPRGVQGFRNLVEICCGLGGIAAGAAFLGCQTIISVDKSPLAVSTVRANGGAALEGDIGSPCIQRQVCEACQYYSHCRFPLPALFESGQSAGTSGCTGTDLGTHPSAGMEVASPGFGSGVCRECG